MLGQELWTNAMWRQWLQPATTTSTIMTSSKEKVLLREYAAACEEFHTAYAFMERNLSPFLWNTKKLHQMMVASQAAILRGRKPTITAEELQFSVADLGSKLEVMLTRVHRLIDIEKQSNMGEPRAAEEAGLVGDDGEEEENGSSGTDDGSSEGDEEEEEDESSNQSSPEEPTAQTDEEEEEEQGGMQRDGEKAENEEPRDAVSISGISIQSNAMIWRPPPPPPTSVDDAPPTTPDSAASAQPSCPAASTPTNVTDPLPKTPVIGSPASSQPAATTPPVPVAHPKNVTEQ